MLGPGSLGDLCSILWWKGLKADAPAAGDACENGGQEAAEDSAAVEILGVVRPSLGQLLAPGPGVAGLCSPRDLELRQAVVWSSGHCPGRCKGFLIDGGGTLV